MSVKKRIMTLAHAHSKDCHSGFVVRNECGPSTRRTFLCLGLLLLRKRMRSAYGALARASGVLHHAAKALLDTPTHGKSKTAVRKGSEERAMGISNV